MVEISRTAGLDEAALRWQGHDVLLGLLAEGGLAIVGHASRVEAPMVCGAMTRTQDRRYGDASLAFYELSADPEATA